MTKNELIKKNQELIKQNQELTNKLDRCEKEVVKTCNANKGLIQKMVDMNVKFYGKEKYKKEV